jgi:hypothetical protein
MALDRDDFQTEEEYEAYMSGEGYDEEDYDHEDFEDMDDEPDDNAWG